MTTEIRVPQMGESVTEGVIAQWLKRKGETVAVDEPVVEIETDKITVEVPAPAAGVLVELLATEGDTVGVGDVIGKIDESATASAGAASPAPAPAASAPAPAAPAPAPAAPAPAPVAAPAAASGDSTPAPPSARAEARRRGVDLGSVQGSGPGGRILKEDVIKAAAGPAPAPVRPPVSAHVASPLPAPSSERVEERKPMTPLRRKVAERLLQSQQGTATLTTFNEVDMSAVIDLRKRYKDRFVQRHGVKLGFMSFFVKAACEALKEFPAVNAEISAEDVVYKYYYDIGVAVGGGKGLVVPVIRSADLRSFADIEATIADFGQRAQANKLTLDELQGGTFTVSNGGVYGSMLSTPILNPPQTGILGLHNIVERPVAVASKVEIRPIMYVALSYDHRLIDGREAVQFLVRIKQLIEDPERLLLDV
ncbi:MAG: 2-oxoglutarate dehydrogenase complex dihydrolipoyllysine-residue succinyltransferase [Myxococcales bacterium]|nr:2-oxoglutarate dehydrogenase complex dihydrolipoyllysine-residue succinyltransferase [Myxococcales bacterium]